MTSHACAGIKLPGWGEGVRLVAQLGGVIRWAVSVDINRAWKAEVAGWYYCTWWAVSLIRVTVPGGLCLR